MARLISLEEAKNQSLIYFREFEYVDGKYQFNIKKEYPYAVYLHQSKTPHLVTIREILEQQCRSIAIYFHVEMDYQYPNQVNHPHSDISIQKHGYYVIQCQLEEDQMILKLRIPQLDKPQIFCPQNEQWQKNQIQAYDRTCEKLGLPNRLKYQWERLNKILEQML